MLYFKLAFRNMKRSIKDYSIYFLTLVFGVCIFYTFNSIESQSIMLDLSKMQETAFKQINTIMTFASVFVSIILGFLIVYANNYIIKRRNKEFGIYITLGMDKSKLSKMIFVETILVGIISLVVGIALGVVLSQGMSVFTAKLFQVNLSKFTFIFSESAVEKTILCFGIIYLIVLVFNYLVINRIKLLDLLNNARKNETVKVRKLWASVLIFIISIGLIIKAYLLIIDADMSALDIRGFGIIILTGSIGTILFFFSLSGFLLKIVQNNKSFYLKNLNMFVLRQINSKINSVFISMSLICLMLFFGICTLSGGLGINQALNSNLEDLTKYDGYIYTFDPLDLEKALKDNNIDIDKIVREKANYNKYLSSVTYEDVLLEEDIKELAKQYYPVYKNEPLEVIKLSDYNGLLKMQGIEEEKLEKNEFILVSDLERFSKSYKSFLNEKGEINFEGIILKSKYKESKNITYYMGMMKSNLGTLIVNDELVENLKLNSGNMAFNFKEGYSDINEIMPSFEDSVEVRKINDILVFSATREELKASSISSGAIISYLGIYIGGIFLITSVAILALQQLSEANDNKERYKLLRKIGTEEKMINKSLFTQIFIYFMMPLSLALIHSIVGLKVAKSIIVLFGDINVMKNVFISLIILLLIYGGYFIATYLGAKKNISQV